jgi:CheY-like chemotaxis protein
MDAASLYPCLGTGQLHILPTCVVSRASRPPHCPDASPGNWSRRSRGAREGGPASTCPSAAVHTPADVGHRVVYGLAALVSACTSSFIPAERIPLIYFLILFPILVLVIFAWLVSRHSGKLFAPSDRKNEDNYVKMQMSVVASLTAATTKGNSSTSESDLENIVDVVRATGRGPRINHDGWRKQILWVDDRPGNNTHERQAFETLGIRFTLALSTNEALDRISRSKFAAIISDMGRREGPREGYVLLDRLRKQGDLTPLFFYASSNADEHRQETMEHGGQGCTNNAQELFRLVTKAVIGRQTA